MGGLATARAGSSRSSWTCYVRDLDLHPVLVDGCATGFTDKHGTPLYKPWLIAVSSASLVEELKNFRCDKSHEHGKIAGDLLTAKTSYYPRALCEAIHRGLDAHEFHRQAGDIPAATAEAGIWNPLALSSAAATVCESEASNRNPLTPSSAAVTVYDLAGGNQTSVDVKDKPKTKHKEASVPDTPLFELRLTRFSLDADDLTGPA